MNAKDFNCNISCDIQMNANSLWTAFLSDPQRSSKTLNDPN